jgi:signal transduction histidine kinase
MKILVQSFFMLFLIVFSSSMLAQTPRFDSLKKGLLSQKEDTSKVNTLVALANALLLRNDFNTALQKANEAFSLSDKLKYTDGKGFAIQCIGSINEMQDNFPEAIANYNKALKFFKESANKNKIADVYTSIASSYNGQDNSVMALENMYKALKVYEETGLKEGLAMTYVMIGGNETRSNDYASAETNFVKALKIFQELRDKGGVAVCYNMLGDILFKTGKYDEALKRQLLALENYDKSEKWNRAACLRGIGNIYEIQGALSVDKQITKNKFNAALEEYTQAIKLLTEAGAGWIVYDAYTDIARLYIRMGYLVKAETYVNESLKYFIEHPEKNDLEVVYKVLTQLDSAKGDFASAYAHHKLYIYHRDSSGIETSLRQVQSLKMQFEYDKKEAADKKIQEQKENLAQRTRNLQYMAIGIVVIIAFFLFLYSRQNRKARNRIEKAYEELRDTQQQLIQREKMASLGELTAGIAHEIQNPLNFVNNFSDVNTELLQELKSELQADNKQEVFSLADDIIENEQKINLHGKRADAIVKGMLQHSRSNTSKKEPTDINKLADEYLRLCYHGLRAKDPFFNATMQTDFDESIEKINIIPQDIGRVLLNLYTNAFYAVHEKKKNTPLRQLAESEKEYEPLVNVTTKSIKLPSGSLGVLISVKDNGNGIPPRVLDKIFQPFFTTKPTGQGTGLGLSLSYDIVKAHGGELKVKTKEGEGSEFIIQLHTE